MNGPSSLTVAVDVVTEGGSIYKIAE